MRKSKGSVQKGFTLIELMVVIAIIGVLSALFINTSTINLKKGRDARRKSDLELIRSGIETYRADCNSYPVAMPFSGTLVGSNANINCANTNTYISKVPQDPSNGNGSSYLYWSDGITYQICTNLEAPPAGTPTVTCGGSSACGSTACNYQVINP